MKRNLLLMAIIISTQTALASAPCTNDLQKVASFDEVMEIVGKSKKPVVLMFGTEWCKFCPQMHEDLATLAQDSSLGNKFVYLEADADNFENIEKINKQLEKEINGYPRVMVFKGGTKGKLVALDEEIFGELDDLRVQLNSLK